MRLDKYLKTARIIKRRVVAKEAVLNDIIFINDKLAKPSNKVKVGDIIKLEFARKTLIIKVTSLTYYKDALMFETIDEIYK